MRATFFLTPWQELREFENTRVRLPGVLFLRGFLGAQADAGSAVDAEAPVRRFSIHSAALRPESTAAEISDSGPMESALAKKIRSSGWLAAGMIFVNRPGVGRNIGWPRR